MKRTTTRQTCSCLFSVRKGPTAYLSVCPGGSYYWLDERGEGLDVGQWLSSNGFTAFVLFYRTAGAPEFVWHFRLVARGVRHPDMITDAQLALKWVWDHSQDYQVDRKRTGIMGFSAGGHLALSTACFYNTDFLDGKCAGEEESWLKPAFAASIYPVVTMKGRYVKFTKKLSEYSALMFF